MWWLASSADGSRLLHIKTLGAGYDQQDPNYCIACHTAASSSGVVHCGRTVCTYAASGFGCLVFSMDTSQLVPANSCEMLVNQWEMVSDLGAYSLFLGVNYPIILPVGGADLARGYLTRSNCVYTSPMSAWQCKMPLPEICRFSLNGEDDVVAFSTGTLAKKNTDFVRLGLVKTPLWFIPSFRNARDWNRPDM